MSNSTVATRNTAFCFKCGQPSSVPLLQRKRCRCGSVCWWKGEKPRPIWRAVTTPAFLAISTEEYERQAN